MSHMCDNFGTLRESSQPLGQDFVTAIRRNSGEIEPDVIRLFLICL